MKSFGFFRFLKVQVFEFKFYYFFSNLNGPNGIDHGGGSPTDVVVGAVLLVQRLREVDGGLGVVGDGLDEHPIR